ncbi:hypothetical protein RvY_03872 [Ramazzottius varieornatus]|uniref:Uncharacterized protein n=1 Tax=Ramazzottius varieornatus TaxID=947166 RepID=A0A1D1UWL8_RAMVA|nr:hypothetical protein RvY_03872 [Ramazzottius varieornatus]
MPMGFGSGNTESRSSSPTTLQRARYIRDTLVGRFFDHSTSHSRRRETIAPITYRRKSSGCRRAGAGLLKQKKHNNASPSTFDNNRAIEADSNIGSKGGLAGLMSMFGAQTITVGECVPLGADVYESLCAVSLASNQLVIRHRDLRRGLQATQREPAVKDVEISHLQEAEIMRLGRRLKY